ncbi:MAG: class I SAM-dependent methyltransferase [Bacillus sp. (in: firmicutes)]
MLNLDNMEKAFQYIDETAAAIEAECNCTYIEALAETAENIFQGDILQDDLSEMSKARLRKKYESVDFMRLDPTTKRKAFQLAILKGMKQNVQPNHQMTPDTIGIFMSYLVRKFTGGQTQIRLLDPVIGTGNLMFALLEQLKDKDMIAIGSDIDDLLVKLAYNGANLLEHSIELYNGDSIRPLFIDPADIVVADLPIGYYPDDERAKEFDVCASEGHTYAHHLLIEQGIRHLKEGGYGLFIVPNSIFQSEQSPLLQNYLKKTCFIQGMVALPVSMFKNEQSAKSILIVQKKQADVTPPKNALLVQLPKMSDAKAMQHMLSQMDEWFQKEKGM